MSSISPEQREFLGRIRNVMLEQHKLLLDRERASFEKLYVPIAGPGAFLDLVIGDPHFAWLKRISTLVVEVDEALSKRSGTDGSMAEALTAQARELFGWGARTDGFQAAYFEAVAQSDAVAAVHRRIEDLLKLG